MAVKIRSNTFETNSSGVHSLAFCKDGRRESVLPMNKSGEIMTRLSEFGKDHRYYKTQEDKLSYLMTCCKYICGGFEIEDIYNTYEFKKIRDVLEDYIPGCTGIHICGDFEDGDIDHQSQPEYGNIDIIDIYDSEQIIDFIFNDYVMLKTDCD